MAWALDARRTGILSPDARLVLVALADYASPEGAGAFPSRVTLAERLGITVRAVARHLSTLRDDGLIAPGDSELVAHYRADRRPSVYDLCLDLIPARGDTTVTPSRGDSADHGVTPRGDRKALPRGDSAVTQTKDLTHHVNQTPLVPPHHDALADPAAALAIEHAQAEGRTIWCRRCEMAVLTGHACFADPMPDNFRELVGVARIAAEAEPGEDAATWRPDG
jgi:hypothetical protein